MDGTISLKQSIIKEIEIAVKAAFLRNKFLRVVETASPFFSSGVKLSRVAEIVFMIVL